MKRDEFLTHANELKAAGLRVFVSKDEDSKYGFAVTQGNRIGYFEYCRFEGWKTSTVHKPNRVTGTGFSMDYDRRKTLAENVTTTAETIAPTWAKRSVATVFKYRDVDEFLNSQNGWYSRSLIEL